MKTEKKLSDSELIQGCLKQDPHFQKEVYKRFSGNMYTLCLRYVREMATAEDILIVGFMKVFDRIHQFNGTGSFGGWIRRIMVNECLMYLEKEKNLYREIGIDGIIPPSAHSLPSDDLAVEDLMKLVDSLPSGYRTVFKLYAIEGYSHQEIAKKLAISENTSKSQLSRARSHLQKMIHPPAYRKENGLLPV
ncbi:MAG: sigma-70 family RNA polymerase sigma factor [Cyclobacteriaceae bacterium]